MPRYAGDPRWLTARFGQCATCQTALKGKRALYFPNGKRAFCERCGEKPWREFAAAAADEAMTTGQW